MSWLWFAGPLVVIVIYLAMSFWPPAEEKRLHREINRWVDEYLGPLPSAGKNQARSRRVRALAEPFEAMVRAAGGGARVADIVLIPKRAYLAVRASSGTVSANQFTVVCKLAKQAPSFVCRPLPQADGRPVPNKGVRFESDPEFMEAFMVEGLNAKAIGKWLKPELREALQELSEVWLRVDDTTMALTLYGSPDADKLDELLATADALFAERGAGRSESLFGEGPPKSAKEPKGRGYLDKPRLREMPVATKKVEETVALRPRITALVIDIGLYVVGLYALALVMGKFAWFHPAVLFNSPDLEVTEQWQGGWTTKGMGAFIAVEAFLLGIFALQTHLASAHGQSIGKRLVGLRIVTEDGAAPGFWRAVVRRQWLLALVPLAVAAFQARPFSSQTFFAALPRLTTAAAAVAALAGAIASVVMSKDGRGIHDRLAGTRLIACAPWRLPEIQLDATPDPKGVSDPKVAAAGPIGILGASDPLAARRLRVAAALLLGWIALNGIVYAIGRVWVYEAIFRLFA
jgi:uncharacterized RDD family membrane protein YckC